VVLRRHTRTVSFRLTDEEYQRLKSRSITCGMNSISDFAREATRQSLIGEAPLWPEVLHRMLRDVDGKVNELDDEVRRLARILENRVG